MHSLLEFVFNVVVGNIALQNLLRMDSWLLRSDPSPIDIGVFDLCSSCLSFLVKLNMMFSLIYGLLIVDAIFADAFLDAVLSGPCCCTVIGKIAPCDTSL